MVEQRLLASKQLFFRYNTHMPQEISFVDLIVHPDYPQIRHGDNAILHPKQEELWVLWDQRLNSIALNPEHLLIHVTSLSLPYSSKPRVVGYAARDREVARIEQELAMMGDRTLLFFNYEYPNEGEIARTMANAGFLFNPGRVKLRGYGVYEKNCVEAWMGSIAQNMELHQKNTEVDSALSLSKQEYDDYEYVMSGNPFGYRELLTDL